MTLELTPEAAGLFRVLVNTENVLLELDGKPASLHGFYANVYVFSWSERTAGESATRKLLKRIRSGEHGAAMQRITLVQMKVEDVERSRAYWKLLRPEGFVIYPMELGAQNRASR